MEKKREEGIGQSAFLIVLVLTRPGPVAMQFWIGLVGVILIAQGLGIVFVYIVWLGLQKRFREYKSWCISNRCWAPIEFLTGFSFLFIFGAGFFIGPIFIMLASIKRCIEPKPKKTTLENVELEIFPPNVSKHSRPSSNHIRKSAELGYIVSS